MSGSRLTISRRRATVMLAMIVSLSWVPGCESPAPLRTGTMVEDGRRAAQTVQDRELELANLRAEIAATKIAAAKKEAELQELRALVTQLRQENGEFRQAVLEGGRAGEAMQVEVAALQSARDELLRKNERHEADMGQVAVLQETVATLSRELGEIKQAMTTATRTAAHNPPVQERTSVGTKGKQKRPPEQDASPRQEATASRVIPAMQVLPDDVGVPKTSRVTVQPGDTLWGIARRHKTTVEALRAANGLQGDQVVAGKELTLP